MSDETKYGLVEPFDVDNDELAGVRPQVVFCLGYEFCEVRTLLDAADGDAIVRTIHTQNVGRIKRMCIRRGRKVRTRAWEDHPDQWHFLEVADAAGNYPPRQDEAAA